MSSSAKRCVTSGPRSTGPNPRCSSVAHALLARGAQRRDDCGAAEPSRERTQRHGKLVGADERAEEQEQADPCMGATVRAARRHGRVVELRGQLHGVCRADMLPNARRRSPTMRCSRGHRRALRPGSGEGPSGGCETAARSCCTSGAERRADASLRASALDATDCLVTLGPADAVLRGELLRRAGADSSGITKVSTFSGQSRPHESGEPLAQ